MKGPLGALLLILVLLVVLGVGLPLLAPENPAATHLALRLRPPFWMDRAAPGHWLGTDHLGRDVLSRVLTGARISIATGLSVVVLAGTFGSLVGLVAGYAGGRLDTVVMRLVDVNVAFPGLLLALLILAVIGPGLLPVVLVLSLNGWMVFARGVRGMVMTQCRLPYVEAAIVTGLRGRRVLAEHILPNLSAPLLTLAVLEFARVVLAEAALSFLGLGIQPPLVSWGLDVAVGRNYLSTAWWAVMAPGLAIAATVMGLNLLAGRLLVALDPQEAEKRFAARLRGRTRGRTRGRLRWKLAR